MSYSAIRTALTACASVVMALAVTTSLVSAAATQKLLSTNYTLVNLAPNASDTATVTVNYYKEDGTAWAAADSSTNFTIAGNGGQVIIAQYFDTTMTSGRGSAVVASSQPLGAVVQTLARNQTPTSGAYIGSSSTASTFYVPLVQKSTTTNSQIMIQNGGTSATTVTIDLVKAAASPGTNFQKLNQPIQAGATYYFDVTDETTIASGWYGSAVITSASQLSVISHKFAGADSLQTFNGFRPNQLGTVWFVPLFAVRLTNGLSTPISVQNLSGATITAGNIRLNCVKDLGSSGTDFEVFSNAAVGNNESYYFNPVTNVPVFTQSNWFGACRVIAPGNVAVFVQMRKPGVSADEAAYEAINASGNKTTVLVPLVAKILANGFATPVTIQNLGGTAATVNITYTPSAAYISAGGSSTPLTESNVSIPANGSLIRNFRLASTFSPTMPNGWYGTMTVTSTGNALDGFVQLTTLGATTGDTLLAHGVFTR